MSRIETIYQWRLFTGLGFIDFFIENLVCLNCLGNGEHLNYAQTGIVVCPWCGGTGKMPSEGAD